MDSRASASHAGRVGRGNRIFASLPSLTFNSLARPGVFVFRTALRMFVRYNGQHIVDNIKNTNYVEVYLTLDFSSSARSG